MLIKIIWEVCELNNQLLQLRWQHQLQQVSQVRLDCRAVGEAQTEYFLLSYKSYPELSSLFHLYTSFDSQVFSWRCIRYNTEFIKAALDWRPTTEQCKFDSTIPPQSTFCNLYMGQIFSWTWDILPLNAPSQGLCKAACRAC